MGSTANGAQRASRHFSSRLVAGMLTMLVLTGLQFGVAAPAAAAAVAPKVAIIVGPAGSATSANLAAGRAAAAEALHYTSNVVEVFSPRATWSRAKAAMEGASVVVYIGRGRGFPSPYSARLTPATEDGIGLNPLSGHGNSTIKFYGESAIKKLHFASNALVILSHVAYASGASEAGRVAPTMAIARLRIANYAAGFLVAGATAVIADMHSPLSYIRAVFTRDATLDTVWRSAPGHYSHVKAFTSSRGHGIVGRTDTKTWRSGFDRSIVGLLSTTTTTVRLGLPAAAPPAGPAFSAVSVKSITQTSAIISWNLNMPATGQVEYGTTTAYGHQTTPQLSLAYSSHAQQISGLAAGTRYHFRLKSQDAAGHLSISSDFSFATLSAAPTPPPPGPPPPPTPAPTPTPTPTPAPPSTASNLPTSIDSTGGSDVSGALMAFIASVPDGGTISFKSGGTYRLDKAIKFTNRHNLTFEGNGATLVGHGGTTEASSIFSLGNSPGIDTGITIRDFTISGNSSSPGVYQGGREGAHGILVDGAHGVDISHVTIRGVWGDCLYVASIADGVSFHDSTCQSSGRNGVTVISARNVTVQRVAFSRSGYTTFDVEPNFSSESATNIKFLDNTAGTWTNSFFSGDGVPGSVVSGITISGNTVTGGTLLTAINLARRSAIVFTNNRSTVTGYGPVLRFAHIDGLTVSGNVQPLSSGTPLASIVDCTAVAYP